MAIGSLPLENRYKPIRNEADYEAALAEIERLWEHVPALRRVTVLILATLAHAYENEHYPMDQPDPIEAIKFRMSNKG